MLRPLAGFGMFFCYVSLAPFTSADEKFRFGAVLSTNGERSGMLEAKQGYELYFRTVNNEADGLGFFLQGRPNTTGFRFQYSFTWLEDDSDGDRHRQQVTRLIEEENIHFLGGSHADFAPLEMQIAREKRILTYQCCAGTDSVFENSSRTFFGIIASSTDYTRDFVGTGLLLDLDSYAIVYQEDDPASRRDGEATAKYFHQAGGVTNSRTLFLQKFNSSSMERETFFVDFAQQARKEAAEVVIGCLSKEDAKRLVDAFHDLKYPLKSVFLTKGPTDIAWVDSFRPRLRADYLYSATQWHPGMRYKDNVFGSAIEYAELYAGTYGGEIPSAVAAGASAVGLTLTAAIRQAFRACDISKTDGDVEALLYDLSAIECDDLLSLRGYDRVVEALSDLDETTFFGRVKFDANNQNSGLDVVVTQVIPQAVGDDGVRDISPVLPAAAAASVPHYPAKNYYPETCMPGHYVGPDPFDRCLVCPLGEFSAEVNAMHCEDCHLGRWNDRPGQSGCVSCPNGTTTRTRAATSVADCVCESGYYSPNGERGQECVYCPSGAKCEGGMSPPVPLEGYWTNGSMRSLVYQCESAEVCIGGAAFACAPGYTGRSVPSRRPSLTSLRRLCSHCEDGYFSALQMCYKCTKPLLILALMLGLFVLWYILNVIVSRSVASLEMILAWAQLANIIGDINLSWTHKVELMFGIANVLDFDVDILEPSCIGSWGFRHNFVMQMCLPFVMSLISLSGYCTASIAHFALVKHKLIRLTARQRRILSFFVSLPENAEGLSMKWDATVAAFLASVDIMYVTIAKYCFDVFKCEHIAGVRVMRVDPNVECAMDSDRALLVTISTLGIVFYVVGYPVWLAWKLCDLTIRCSFSHPTNLRRYGFIYEKYELEYAFTPAIVLGRKLLFVLVLVYMNNPAFQVGTLSIISIASLMIHIYSMPYVDTSMDWLFSFLLVALMCEAFGGLIFYSENLPSADREILEWLVISTAIVMSIAFFAIFCVEISRKYHMNYINALYKTYVTNKQRPLDRVLCPNLHARLFKSQTSLASSAATEAEQVSKELLDTFDPRFVYKCMRKDPSLIQKWDKVTFLLKDAMSDQSVTSYLSMNPVAKFWRKLVDRFPELVDFLAATDERTREAFNKFATGLYRDFYLTKKLTSLPLMEVLNWRDYAPMAQWLAMSQPEDRNFFISFLAEMYKVGGNEDAADIMESRLRHGGTDPQLERRGAGAKLPKRRERILRSLKSGSHPFETSTSGSDASGFGRMDEGSRTVSGTSAEVHCGSEEKTLLQQDISSASVNEDTAAEVIGSSSTDGPQEVDVQMAELNVLETVTEEP